MVQELEGSGPASSAGSQKPSPARGSNRESGAGSDQPLTSSQKSSESLMSPVHSDVSPSGNVCWYMQVYVGTRTLYMLGTARGLGLGSRGLVMGDGGYK